jgi:hypothetical protein
MFKHDELLIAGLYFNGDYSKVYEGCIRRGKRIETLIFLYYE